MNLSEAADHIGISRYFLNYLHERDMIHFLDKDDISMVECTKYRTEFALGKLELMSRFFHKERDKMLLDELILDELNNL